MQSGAHAQRLAQLISFKLKITPWSFQCLRSELEKACQSSISQPLLPAISCEGYIHNFLPKTGKLGVANRFGAANQSINVYRLSLSGLGTATKETINTKINIYQSGSNIVVDLNGLSGRQSILIYDINGRNLVSRQANGGEKLLITKVLNSCVYVVKVQGDERTIYTKLIAKKII